MGVARDLIWVALGLLAVAAVWLIS